MNNDTFGYIFLKKLGLNLSNLKLLVTSERFNIKIIISYWVVVAHSSVVVLILPLQSL